MSPDAGSRVLVTAPSKAHRDTLLYALHARARTLRRAKTAGRFRTEKVSPTRFYAFGQEGTLAFVLSGRMP